MSSPSTRELFHIVVHLTELTGQLASRQEQLASLTSELESMQGVVAGACLHDSCCCWLTTPLPPVDHSLSPRPPPAGFCRRGAVSTSCEGEGGARVPAVTRLWRLVPASGYPQPAAPGERKVSWCQSAVSLLLTRCVHRAVGRLQGQVTALKDEAAKARSELETGQDHFVQECERLKAHHHSEMSAAEQRLEQLVWTPCGSVNVEM